MSVRLSEARKKAAAAAAKVQEVEKEAADAIKEALEEGSRALFEEYGDVLGSFAWTQYTPYFNDGDVCEFSAHLDDPTINSVKDIEAGTESREPYEHGADFAAKSQKERYVGYNSKTYTSRYENNPDYDERYHEVQEAVTAFLSALDGGGAFEGALKRLFGDHALVVVTKDGIEVDEYSHE